MKRNLCLLLLAGSVVYAVPLLAHHSFAATYFDDKTDTVEGNLVQFVFRNPHSFVHIEAPDEKGQSVRWAVEWGSGQQLSGQGVPSVWRLEFRFRQSGPEVTPTEQTP